MKENKFEFVESVSGEKKAVCHIIYSFYIITFFKQQ